MTCRKTASLLLVLALLGSTLHAETLNLSLDFVNQCKNRATIAINFELDAHLTSPHQIGRSGDDGDIHMAGRAPEVQLPMVAEIMNAGQSAESASVHLMNNTPTGQTVPLTGVWRIWFEHPSPGDQTQGDPVGIPANSNPDHVFEIHPITNFDGQDVADSSLVPITDPSDGHSYSAYPANTAFAAYEKLQATITVSDSSVSIDAKQAGYNYTEFLLEPAGTSAQGDNGIFVLANVYDLSDPESPVTVSPRRMVFVDNTEPAKQLASLSPGQRLHVMGIPRVNLAEVAAVSGGNPVDMALPYEMIIVAVFPDGQTPVSAPANAELKGESKGTHKKAPPTE
jgi:hypothetical protein